MYSCVLILPIDQVETGNNVGVAMGWGPDNYSVPLSQNGTEPATHLGLHSWVESSFQELVESKTYPEELSEAGITEAEYDSMMDSLIYSFWSDYIDHFSTIITENDLRLVDDAFIDDYTTTT
jgi:hypothetical protein